MYTDDQTKDRCQGADKMQQIKRNIEKMLMAWKQETSKRRKLHKQYKTFLRIYIVRIW